MTSQDAQFIDTLKDVRRQILGCLRVPLYMAGDPEKLSFNTIEQLSIQFITYTMLPYFVRWEQTIARDLLTVKERTKLFAEFLVDGLQRGDLGSRYSAYATGRQWGWLSVNDIRRFENQDPVEGGDVYLQPLNMIDSTEASDYLSKGLEAGEKTPGNKSPHDDNSNPTLKNSEIHAILNARAENQPKFDSERLFEEFRKIAEKVDKIAEKEQKSPENSDNRNEKLMLGLAVTKEGNSKVIAEVLARAMRKESAAIATATRKNKLDTLEADFYEDHSRMIKESLTTLVNSQFDQMSALRVASGYNSGSVPASERDELLDVVVTKYNSAYRNAGDNAESRSRDLALIVVEMIEKSSLTGR
jgi:hypothetical protein